ncbi:hypothetical protein ACVH9Z_27865 [Rhodococcus opacus]
MDGLATERVVPLSVATVATVATVAALDEWTDQRGVCRPLLYPRTWQLTDFPVHLGTAAGPARPGCAMG